jgi:diguanylate cyclase (GGDEF)-like protein
MNIPVVSTVASIKKAREKRGASKLSIADSIPFTKDDRDIWELTARVKHLEGLLRETRKKSHARIIELERALANAEKDSITDALTGLYNRRHFDASMEMQSSIALRQYKCFSLIIGDVDHFKSINDTHGHPVGDQVLKKAGMLLRLGQRPGDSFFRYGGEEFAFILAESESYEAQNFLKRLQSRFEKELVIELGTEIIKPTLSFGLTTWDRRTKDSSEAMCARADAALYAAKRAGRNCVRVE